MADSTSESEIVTHLRADLTEATRARDQVRMDTIRMALDGFTQEEVARSRAALSDLDRAVVLDKQIKQRVESAGIYREAGRAELAEKETRQADILRAYLPARMTDEDIRALVADLIARHGKEFRAVMPLASKETRGRADGKRVNEIVREMTA